ncbi:MAG: hypothetical protein HYU53_13390 [Acidobacteria bacterium]|nr:hypothetical protein [Acidobacteriota bacterium]
MGLKGQGAGLDRRITAPMRIEVTKDASKPEEVIKSRMSILSRVARVSTGFEEALDPPVDSRLRDSVDLRGMTVRQALDTLIALDPRYEWREVFGVVTMRSRAAWDDCNHFLNRQVAFERQALTTASVSRALLHLIDPTVPERPSREPPGPAPKLFSLEVTNGTLLEVFNVAATKGQLFWSITYGAEESEGRWIELSLESLDGPRVGWAGSLRPLKGSCTR